MPITINGNGTISGLSAGGLPNGSVTNDTLATNAKSLFSSFAIIEHYEAHGTQGQLLNADTWTGKKLNRIYTDPDSIVSLSNSNDTDFILGAGTYYITWNCCFFEVDRCQTRLINVTNGNSIVKYSQNAFSQNSSAHASVTPPGDVRITITGDTTFRLQAYADNGSVAGNAEMGIPGSTHANNDGSEEIYARVIIYKEA